jgi:hypothetical protein
MDDWGLRSRVHGIVFDTTVSNTGLKNDAFTFIENSIKQELAWVACCHHVMELPLAAVFCYVFGPTGGPDVAIFMRFQQCWPHTDLVTYKVTSNYVFYTHTSAFLKEMVTFYKAALEGSHQRRLKGILENQLDLPGQ